MSEKQVFRSKATILLRETWRKAYRKGLEGQQLVITFRTESQAHKCRMDLYKAVQPEKQGRGEDLELIRAAQGTEIVLGHAKNQLVMRPRGQNDIFAALQDATGLQLETVEDPVAAASVKESLKQLDQFIQREEASPQPSAAPATGLAATLGARHAAPPSPPVRAENTAPPMPEITRSMSQAERDRLEGEEMNRLIYERNKREREEREQAERDGKMAS